MFRRFRQTAFGGAGCALLIFIGLMLIGGCGNFDRSPVVSTSVEESVTLDSFIPTPDGPSYIAFSPAAVVRAQHLANAKRLAKVIVPDSLYSEDTLGLFSVVNGGAIQVQFVPYGNANTVRVEQAVFTVVPNAVPADTTITMDVTSGTQLDDIVAAFGPSGLTFSPFASLQIAVSGELNIEPQNIVAYHIYADGTVTTTNITIEQTGVKAWLFSIEVPGFSRYGFDDGGE